MTLSATPTTPLHAAHDWWLQATSDISDPLRQGLCVCTVTAPDGSVRTVPAFWAGQRRMGVRVSSDQVGDHQLRLRCTDPSLGLDGQRLTLRVTPTAHNEPNPLLRLGPVRMSDDGSRLVHHDGSPYLWFADTWWMLMSDRVSFPDGFQRLTAHRLSHGINTVQVVVGFPPDSTPFTDHAEDNEAGPPWHERFTQLNPAHFDHVDERLRHLIDQGITPCILGGWGYQLQFMTEANMTAHWRYLVARYAAWPVVWMLAGETAMRYYLSTNTPQHDEAQLKAAWSRVASIVRDIDPYHRPLTTHPRRATWDDIDQPEQLDFHTVQTGHMPNALQAGIDTMTIASTKVPGKLVINAEPPYENHGGTNGPDIQRHAFWSAMLGGYKGYTYGAAGVFQANDADRPTPNRPDGGVFDRSTWVDALDYPGLPQLAQGIKLLRSMPFESFTDQSHRFHVPLRWGADLYRPALRLYAAGVAGECILVYIPLRWYHWDGLTLKDLAPSERYHATYIDPESFDTIDAGITTPDEHGHWTGPITPYLHDWLILLKRD